MDPTICPYCGTFDQEKKFCTKCGAALNDYRTYLEKIKTPLEGSQGIRSPFDVAVRIEALNLKGFMKKELIVEAGSRAIFLSDGKYAGSVPAGRYTMGGLYQIIHPLKKTQNATAILIQESDIHLNMSLFKLYTKDDEQVDLHFSVTVKINESGLFLTQLMRGRERLSVFELISLLRQQFYDVFKIIVSEYEFSFLKSDSATKQKLESVIIREMRTALRAYGLGFSSIRSLEFRNRRHERLMELKLDNKAKIYELSEEAAFREKRVKILDDLLRVENLEKITRLKNEEEWLNFKTNIDKDRLLRDEEWLEFKQAAFEKRQDRELTRQHLLNKLNLQRQIEIDKLKKEYQREQLISDTENKAKIRDIERDIEAKDDDADLNKLERLAEIAQKKKRMETKTVVCPTCGTGFPIGSTFCTKCGKRLS